MRSERDDSGSWTRHVRFVVAVIAFLSLLIGSMVLVRRWMARRAAMVTALAHVAELTVALKRYDVDCAALPTTAQGLSALATDPGVKGWRGPYVASIAVDPWGAPYRYELVSGGFRVVSAGPDGKHGTLDDIR